MPIKDRRRVYVTLTIPQTRAVRLALKSYLEWEDVSPVEMRTMSNALDRLDAAERLTRRIMLAAVRGARPDAAA